MRPEIRPNCKTIPDFLLSISLAAFEAGCFGNSGGIADDDVFETDFRIENLVGLLLSMCGVG